MSTLDAVVHGASEVVVGPEGDRGEEFGRLTVQEDGAVAVVDGTVAAVGPSAEVCRQYPTENADTVLDTGGQAVLPGFVDSHTHALFAGDRSDEFAARLRGKSYQTILDEGGGIRRTVRAVRSATDEHLLARLLDHLDTMLAAGTTTVEVKSGYGLDAATERRMLDVVARARETHPIDVVPTFMGAHAVPEGVDTDTYVENVVEEQLPAVSGKDLAAFCDVFCEDGVFSVEQSRRVLTAGDEHGLVPKVHAEEFCNFGGARLAAEVGAASADHLLHATEDDAVALADAGVTPVVLPGTAFGLGTDYADARMLRATGAPIGLATDFNPNCHAPTMPFAVTLACVEMGLPPGEAIAAATRGGALALAGDHELALDPDEEVGRLCSGAPGDVVVLDAPSHGHVPYRFGEPVVDTVLKGGQVVACPAEGVRR
jgi:imidazolonepropionase